MDAAENDANLPLNSEHGRRGNPRMLRDYLYVDSRKVRGLLSQMTDGIVEMERMLERQEKLTGGGVKGFAEHSQRWGTDRTTEKTMGDLLFPTLEESLEAEGFLTDISDICADPSSWETGRVADVAPTGSFVRVSAMASLFDARYVADVMASMLTTSQGLEALGREPDASTAKPPKAKSPQERKDQRARQAGSDQGADNANLEDRLPNVPHAFGEPSISRTMLEGMVRISRGVFAPGFHMFMEPGVNLL